MSLTGADTQEIMQVLRRRALKPAWDPMSVSISSTDSTPQGVIYRRAGETVGGVSALLGVHGGRPRSIAILQSPLRASVVSL
jgi:hypothetical protein